MTGSSQRPWFEAAFGRHYPHLYAHRDLDEARRCLDLLSRLAPPGRGPVLDLGCGQGRHLEILRQRRLPAVGLDLSRPLLTAARRSLPQTPLLQADMRSLPLRRASCTAVLSLFTAFGYFGPAAAHRPVVAEIARVLVPGGHWFLDFLDSERVARELEAAPAASERVLAGGVVQAREHRRLATDPRRVIKTVELRPAGGHEQAAAALGIGPEGLRYTEQVTLLSLDELVDLAAGAGLRQVAAAGDYAGADLIPGRSDRWILVFTRDDAKD